MGFKEVKADELQFNPFRKIFREWMLVTAGNKEQYNTMTASWGGLGITWNKRTATIYVRPQRYTKQFIDANDYFTLSFFDETYRNALNICGSVSGRDDPDKATKAGLTPLYIDNTTAFNEANMILVCRKLLHTELQQDNFELESIVKSSYPDKDFHTLYIAEIVKVLVQE